MPKISVHLEADSAEEFLALLGSFKINTSRPVEVEAPRPQDEDLARQYESIGRIKRDIEAGTFGVASQREPQEEQNKPVVEAVEAPVKPKRGRPFKTAPVEPEPTVAVQPEPEVAQPAAEVVAAPVKPKAMPHAQPENGAATRQDLLDVFSEYVQRYGASFGFSDISQLLQKNLGDTVRKASDVPEAQLQVAIGAIKTAIADNPFNRKRDYA